MWISSEEFVDCLKGLGAKNEFFVVILKSGESAVVMSGGLCASGQPDSMYKCVDGYSTRDTLRLEVDERGYHVRIEIESIKSAAMRSNWISAGRAPDTGQVAPTESDGHSHGYWRAFIRSAGARAVDAPGVYYAVHPNQLQAYTDSIERMAPIEYYNNTTGVTNNE